MDVSVNTNLVSEVSGFLTYEANLLDSGNFDEWLNLFDPDAIYWIPSSADQTDMKGQISIILEDLPLLKLRVKRLSHPRAYSVTPPPATIHLIGNIKVEQKDKIIVVNSNLIVTEVRDDSETQFIGSVTHHLRSQESSFRIQSKRIDLLKANGTLSVISVPL